MGTKILAGAFGILGVLLLVNGLMSLYVGLFVGPHLLVASLGCGVFGALGISVAFGFDRGRAWAWKAGLLWTTAVLAVALTAVYQSGVEEDAAGRIFYGIMSGVFGSLLILLVVGWLLKRKRMKIQKRVHSMPD